MSYSGSLAVLIHVKPQEKDTVHPRSQPGSSTNPTFERKKGGAIQEITAPCSRAPHWAPARLSACGQVVTGICSVLGPRAVETNKTLTRPWGSSRSGSRQTGSRQGPVRTPNVGGTHCAATELGRETHSSAAGEEGEKVFQRKEQHEKVEGMTSTWSAGQQQEDPKLSPGPGSLT